MQSIVPSLINNSVIFLATDFALKFLLTICKKLQHVSIAITQQILSKKVLQKLGVWTPVAALELKYINVFEYIYNAEMF